jgi:hypothetical protein
MTKISCPSLFQSNQDWIVMLRVGKVGKAEKHQLIPGPSHLFGKTSQPAFDRSRGKGSLESTKVVVKKLIFMLIKSYICGCETVVGDEVLHYVALVYVMELEINNNYFTSCDPHHDMYTFSYWQIFWHSI